MNRNFLRWRVAAAALVAFVATPARAGTSVGNGGQSVFCYGDVGGPVRPESYDLYEGAVLFNYSYEGNDGADAWEIARRALSRLGPEEARAISSRLTDLLGRIDTAEASGGEGLPLTADIAPIVIPTQCELRQTVVFKPDGGLVIDTYAWKLLPPLARAALYLHEAIYWELRASKGELNSQRARRIVAWLLADQSEGSRIDFSVDSRPVVCQAGVGNERYFLALNPSGQVSMGVSRSPSDWSIVGVSPQGSGLPGMLFPESGSTDILLGPISGPQRAVHMDWTRSLLTVPWRNESGDLFCAIRNSL